MSNPDLTDPSALEQVSALVDGELDLNAVNEVCRAWREKPTVRADWHAFQLIGDVLRSEDLASSASRDAVFLASLRERLAGEPVVLAPDIAAEPLVAVEQPVYAMAGGGRSGRRWTWAGTSAVAAGFMVVAGALIVSRGPADSSPVGPVATLVKSAEDAPSPQSLAPSEQPVLVVDGAVLRDPQLDRYLSAHKQFATTSVLGGPSGFLRNAAAEVPR